MSLLVSGSAEIAPCTSDNARGTAKRSSAPTTAARTPVVDGDADTARDPALPHRFHSGTHRRSDDDREQEEQDDKPDLPHRESQNHE
jgi:hypothetical protein